ncbi:MAG: hypothetical protein ACLFUI_02185 [Halanaerobiales bacterium]
MKLKAFVALSAAILAYTITVLTGLVQGLPLLDIFINGLINTILFTTTVWLVIFLLEIMADRYENSEANSNNNKTNISSSEENSDNETNQTSEESQQILQAENQEIEKKDAEANFSPLTPPVLEVSQQETEGGAGN